MMYSSVADSAAVPYNGYIAMKWCLSCDLYLEINKSIGSLLFFSIILYNNLQYMFRMVILVVLLQGNTTPEKCPCMYLNIGSPLRLYLIFVNQ